MRSKTADVLWYNGADGYICKEKDMLEQYNIYKDEGGYESFDEWLQRDQWEQYFDENYIKDVSEKFDQLFRSL